MKWNTSQTPLPDDEGVHFTLLDNDNTLSYAAVLELWRDSEAFRNFFIDCLAEAPYPACFWETPPVTRGTIERPFEFVLIRSTGLENAAAEPEAFAEHFRQAGDREVVCFDNLGGDAELVVPTPRAGNRCYPHLTAFARHAPRGQQHALWQAVGEALSRQLGNRPLWLSTAGLGVYWVHVRLDMRPKYYNHRPYRSPPRA